MTTARFILALAVLLFGACIVLMNWWCVIVSARNKRRGIGRHHSMVSLVSIIFAALAYILYPQMDIVWIISVPLLDIANWHLLWLPVALVRKPKTDGGAEPPAQSDRRTRF